MDKLTKLRNELQNIVGQLENLQAKDGDFTNEELETIQNLNTDFEAKKGQLEALEKIENMKNVSTSSNRKTTPRASVPRAEVGKDNFLNDPKLGFKNMGEFAVSVKNFRTTNTPDERLKKIMNSHVTYEGASAGFLVPEEFSNSIEKKVQSDESLLPKTRQLVTGSNNITLPTHENASWDNNGIQAYWVGEGNPLTSSKEDFGQASLKLHKLGAFMTATEEMLEDSNLLESFINQHAPEVIMHKINDAILNGDGVQKPKGILNSSFGVTVSKEAGQAADTILYENIVKMASRMLPGSYSRAVWVINPQVMEQLRLMSFKDGAASPVPVYLPPSGLDASPYGTLMGRPILPMMGASQGLGDRGDIQLIDFSYYTSLVKSSGIKSAISTHLLFDQDKSAFKFTFRVAGDCLYKSPITTENGNYSMSGFISLEAR